MRKNEIIEHPYFSKFSNFTQDLDRFYKDMTGNDTIASVYKYTKVLWNFLKDKYFKLVPFGKELQDVVSEILNELNELRKLPSVQYLTEKYNQLYAKARWLYEYFDMETRIHRFITLIHRKLTDMTQTALQAENRLVGLNPVKFQNVFRTLKRLPKHCMCTRWLFYHGTCVFLVNCCRKWNYLKNVL